jgi:hypothetical protein
MQHLPKHNPSPLPATTSQFLERRKLKAERTLNDHVETIHLKLYDDPTYHSFLEAVYDEQAVEGSLAADNIEAARMIREKASKDGDLVVTRQKYATISKSLSVVLRRYGASRKERRNMIGGEVVPGDNGD